MSLYDRDYYRRTPPPGSPFGSPAAQGLSFTTWIILVNAGLFVFDYFVIRSLGDSPLRQWVPYVFYTWPESVFGRGMIWQLVTGAFFHADLWHLLFNMWVLYMFGRPLEDILGARRYLGFYFSAAVLASLCYVVWALASGKPNPALGASGAVMGVVVLYAFHRPRQLIYIWGLLPLQVRWFAVIVVGLDLLLLLGRANTNVAHVAHLGGAVFGAVYRYVSLRWPRWMRRWRAAGAGRSAPPPPWPSAGGAGPHAPPPDGPPMEDMNDMNAVERRVDLLLDKISRHGLPSLTEEERTFLREASRRYGR